MWATSIMEEVVLSLPGPLCWPVWLRRVWSLLPSMWEPWHPKPLAVRGILTDRCLEPGSSWAVCDCQVASLQGPQGGYIHGWILKQPPNDCSALALGPEGGVLGLVLCLPVHPSLQPLGLASMGQLMLETSAGTRALGMWWFKYWDEPQTGDKG